MAFLSLGMRVMVLDVNALGFNVPQVRIQLVVRQRSQKDATHRRAVGRQAAADGEPGGENAAGGGARDVHDLAAVEHAHRGRLVQLFRDVFEDRAGGLHYGRGREKREAEAQDLGLEAINLARALHVSQQFKGEQDAADGRAGQPSGLGDLHDAAAVVMAFEAFNDAKPRASERTKSGFPA